MTLLLLIATFFAILVGLTVTAVVIKQVQRQRYVKSLTGRGWQFIDDPTVDEIAMLHKPPFGRQFQRTADELTRGQTTDGNWFQAFDYRTTEFKNRVLTVRLPRAPVRRLRASLADPNHLNIYGCERAHPHHHAHPRPCGIPDGVHGGFPQPAALRLV